jgi:beta-glucosidase
MPQKSTVKYKTLPFWNTALPLEERIEDLLSRLTLEEKAGLISAEQQGVERLGISEWWIGCEIARGYVGRTSKEPSTVFPQPIGLAATFDKNLMYQIGEAAGKETRVYYQKEKKGKLMVWGPTVDMERDPRWGRTEEAYGEDPYLTGEMTQEYTKGLKGEDEFYYLTAPALKHFCANNNEKDRGKCSANLEPRTKHEYYYKAFQPAITEGGAVSLMAAYNELSGVPAILNPDLKTIVKDQWGLEFVVSDGCDFSQNISEHHYVDSHAESVALAMRAGTDIMTDDSKLVYTAVLEAIRTNLLTEAELNESLKRVFKVRFHLGEFDPEDRNPYGKISEQIINCKEHITLNNRAAKEQMVLLKNNGILPLCKKSRKLTVLGPLADINYADWYTGFSNYLVSPLGGLKEYLGEEAVSYDNGYDRIALKVKSTGKYLSVTDNGEVIGIADNPGERELFECHSWDKEIQNFYSVYHQNFLRDEGEEGIKATGTSTYHWFVKEGFSCRNYTDMNQEEYTTINLWNSMEAVIDDKGYLKSCLPSRMTEQKLFQLELQSSGIERAKVLAREAETAIVIVGNDPMQVARECYDREDIVLPKHQQELIRAVYDVNPNTIVVVVSSYPYALNWEKTHIPAILYSCHAGPELGKALAQVLYGSYNPAGRLPMTWYTSVRELPDIMDYDIIKNHTTYLYYDGKPLFPFGHGLSYSDFSYDKLQVKLLEGCNGNTEKIQVSLNITNTSKLGGEEVIQVYFRIVNPRVIRPLKQLCGFQRIYIEAGETKEIIFNIDKETLQFYDVTREKFCVETGEYVFRVGSSSEDIRLEHCIWIDGEKIPAQTLEKTTPAINYDDKEGVVMLFSKKREKHYLVTEYRSGIIRYQQVTMNNITAVELEAATAEGSRRVFVHIDSVKEEPICIIDIPITLEKEAFVTCTGLLKGITGIHDLYLVLEGKVSLLSLKLV